MLAVAELDFDEGVTCANGNMAWVKKVIATSTAVSEGLMV
jgi:hypothetical protein